ncbi:hypothetical protein [Halocola ammonii]
MNKLLFLPIIFFMTCAMTCGKDDYCPDDAHSRLYLRNESDVRIHSRIYWNYPDTTLGEYPVYDGDGGVLPNDFRAIEADIHSCWENALEGRSEWIYIFNADTIETLDWETVQQTNRGLLERIEINLEYLGQNDFNVVYE